MLHNNAFEYILYIYTATLKVQHWQSEILNIEITYTFVRYNLRNGDKVYICQWYHWYLD